MYNCFYLVCGCRHYHTWGSSHALVNNTRLKAFMDAYHAPYKARQWYILAWTSCYLCFTLFLYSALNPQQDPGACFLVILVGTADKSSRVWTFHTSQGHATVEPTEGTNTVHRRLIPTYTYGANLVTDYTTCNHIAEIDTQAFCFQLHMQTLHGHSKELGRSHLGPIMHFSAERTCTQALILHVVHIELLI